MNWCFNSTHFLNVGLDNLKDKYRGQLATSWEVNKLSYSTAPIG